MSYAISVGEGLAPPAAFSLDKSAIAEYNITYRNPNGTEVRYDEG